VAEHAPYGGEMAAYEARGAALERAVDRLLEATPVAELSQPLGTRAHAARLVASWIRDGPAPHLVAFAAAVLEIRRRPAQD
jgi:hypothetical protein